MFVLNGALSSILLVLGASDRADTPSSATTPLTADLGSESHAATPAADVPGANQPGAAKTVYVCPMHPEVISDAPGLCPKCSMKLDPKPQVTERMPGHAAEARQRP